MQVSELIAKAWYFSGIVSREFEVVSDAQTADGLYQLNMILSKSGINTNLISYETHTDITLVPGQEKYFVPNLIDVRVVTFTQGQLRFPMNRDSQLSYWAQGRVNNIKSLPFHYYTEREQGGINIYLYFLPDQAYILNVLGKYQLLDSVTIDMDLTGYDDFFLDYLSFLLARRLCIWRNVPVNSNIDVEIENYEKLMKRLTPYDLTMMKANALVEQPRGVWSYFNLGRGFSP